MQNLMKTLQSGLTLLVTLSLVFFTENKSVAASPQQQISTGAHQYSITHNQRSRFYDLHVPKRYKRNRRLPLVIVLHGGGGNGGSVKRMTGMSAKADKEGFIVAYPYGTGRFRKFALTWNAANCCGYANEKNIDDVGFISAMIDKIQKDYGVDPRRIYATGISNGGMMAFRLGVHLSNKIAAIAPVAAAFNEKDIQPEHPVSLLMINGILDKRVLYEGGFGPEAAIQREDRSVAATIALWIDFNKCYPESEVSHLQNRLVSKDEFKQGLDQTSVVLYTLNGGGHAWPGGRSNFAISDTPNPKISATDIIWEFFKNNPKP